MKKGRDESGKISCHHGVILCERERKRGWKGVSRIENGQKSSRTDVLFRTRFRIMLALLLNTLCKNDKRKCRSNQQQSFCP